VTTRSGASRWTIPIFALFGLGIGLLLFAFQTPSYEAEALVAVSNPAGTVEDEIEVVQGSTVINAASQALGFTPDITVSAAEVASLLTITATADDPDQAALAANTVATAYVQAQVGAAANLAQPAEAPTSSSGLGSLVYAAVGSILGALAGLGVGYFQSLSASSTSSDPSHADSSQSDPSYPDPSPSETPAMSDSPIVPPDDEAAARSSTPSNEQPLAPEPITAETQVPQIASSGSFSSFSSFASETGPIEAPAASTNPVATPSGIAPDTAPIWSEAPPEPALASEPDFVVASNDLFESTLDRAPALTELAELDRRALVSQFETAQYELVLSHNEAMARSDAEHERQVATLRADVSDLNKQLRMQEVRLKNRTGNDQTRVGDLEAQTVALEAELAESRRIIESERIAHSKRLTEERGAADRALDNARRQYREELAKHTHAHRQTLAEHRADLDNELAEDRSKHALALEEQHVEYERQLEAERHRLEATLAAATDRHQRELADVRATTDHELERQANQHKETISELRAATDNSDAQLQALEKANRQLKVEQTTQQQQARHNEVESRAMVQRLSDEISIMRGELDGERERNAALRADVLRRSSEAHQAVDRAVEERTAQLAELEASVARQREYADRRVREISAASEEHARQAAAREAELAATISRLKRELAEALQDD